MLAAERGPTGEWIALPAYLVFLERRRAAEATIGFAAGSTYAMPSSSGTRARNADQVVAGTTAIPL